MALVIAKWRRGLDSDLEKTELTNGHIYLSKDTGRLHIDIDDARVEVTDFVKITETEILNTLTPLPKFYYATDTHKVWYYDSTEGWVCLGASNAEYAEKDGDGNVISDTYATITYVNDLLAGIDQFEVLVVDELPEVGQSGILYLVPNDEGTEDNNVYVEYVWVMSLGIYEKLGTTKINLDNYVTLDGEQAITNKTYNGYTLASACSYSATDRTTATAISNSGTTLLTERAIYYGLPMINGDHSYNSNTDIYVPTSAGTSGYILTSSGSGEPNWTDPSDAVKTVGAFYGSCSTAASTVAKTMDIDDFSLDTGVLVAVTFTYAVPAEATLNISSTGAKDIYHMGSAIRDNMIQAGATALFIYTGSQYFLLATDTEAGSDYIRSF